MKKQHTFGALFPTKPETITPQIRHRIHDALVTTRLLDLISADRCQLENAVRVEHTAVAEKGNHSALELIQQLEDFLWRVHSAGLELEGELTITVTGKDPVFYRVIVTNSELHYRRITS